MEAVMFQRNVHHPSPAAGDRPGPPWRLLIESPDPVLAISNFEAFHDAGFEVTLCEGPIGQIGECPVVHGEPCPLLHEADVVLFDLDTDPVGRSKVLAAMSASRPELPIVVRSISPPADVTASHTTIRVTTSVGGQASALRQAVLQSARPRA
jgi:hypothetical protein